MTEISVEPSAAQAAPLGPATEGSLMQKNEGANGVRHGGATEETRGEVVLQSFTELLARGDNKMSAAELGEFGWEIPLVTHCDPSPGCIPGEIFSFEPGETEIFKIFFKGTTKEVRIRQIFFHTPLTSEEQDWLSEFRDLCAKLGWTIPLFLEPMLLRIIWLVQRKWGDNILNRSLELAKSMVTWRESFFPLSDEEEELQVMLHKGVMYWAGRDQSLRPLLIIRLARLQRSAAPEAFKRLTIFCFEWGLRFLMIPGLVETITVLLDVRGLPLHQFPISALTDMTNTLTKQYPFRLNRMVIVNDSFFVQSVWNIAKQFLTEVQQQKMSFFRSGFEEELLKDYTPWQLEKAYGGSRPDITSFYPFPVACGPYAVGSTEQNPHPYLEGSKAVNRLTTLGVLWEGECRTPIQWAPGAVRVFEDLGLPYPDLLAAGPSASGDDQVPLASGEAEPDTEATVAVPAGGVVDIREDAPRRAEESLENLKDEGRAMEDVKHVVVEVPGGQVVDAAGSIQGQHGPSEPNGEAAAPLATEVAAIAQQEAEAQKRTVDSSGSHDAPTAQDHTVRQ